MIKNSLLVKAMCFHGCNKSDKLLVAVGIGNAGEPHEIAVTPNYYLCNRTP